MLVLIVCKEIPLEVYLNLIHLDLNLSKNGIIKRDELLFSIALNENIPILMLLSGGYQKENAPVIADSIENLFVKFDLTNRYNLHAKNGHII